MAKEKPRSQKSFSELEKKLLTEFEKGEFSARDPENADLPDGAPRKTTIYADWLIDDCENCDHPFRLGDMVKVCPSCNSAFHEDDRFPLLCWTEVSKSEGECPSCGTSWTKEENKSDEDKEGTRESYAEVAKIFTSGMLDTWKAFGDVPVRRAEKGDSVIGKNCPMCDYQIRRGDHYVTSFCKGKCKVYIHNDIFRNLTCWNNWQGMQGKRHCFISGGDCELLDDFMT